MLPAERSPKITVVIPVLNEENLLPDTLQALCTQTFRDYDCVVVDNGSTDNTVKIARSFGCHVVTEERQGVGFARQRGFEEARGEIIASTDADTIVPCDWLELIARTFQQKPDLVAVYGTIRFRERQGLGRRLAESFFTYFLRLNHFLGRPHFCGPNFAVRREAFVAVDGFKDGNHFYTVSEDVQLSLKLKNKGDIYFHKGLVVHTSSRKLGKGGHRYVWHHTKNYWSVVWLGKKR
jgi:glycosyltransferase involved in cell wall biosynthesis